MTGASRLKVLEVCSRFWFITEDVKAPSAPCWIFCFQAQSSNKSPAFSYQRTLPGSAACLPRPVLMGETSSVLYSSPVPCACLGNPSMPHIAKGPCGAPAKADLHAERPPISSCLCTSPSRFGPPRLRSESRGIWHWRPSRSRLSSCSVMAPQIDDAS